MRLSRPALTSMLPARRPRLTRVLPRRFLLFRQGRPSGSVPASNPSITPRAYELPGGGERWFQVAQFPGEASGAPG